MNNEFIIPLAVTIAPLLALIVWVFCKSNKLEKDFREEMRKRKEVEREAYLKSLREKAKTTWVGKIPGDQFIKELREYE